MAALPGTRPFHLFISAARFATRSALSEDKKLSLGHVQDCPSVRVRRIEHHGDDRRVTSRGVGDHVVSMLSGRGVSPARRGMSSRGTILRSGVIVPHSEQLYSVYFTPSWTSGSTTPGHAVGLAPDVM